MERENSLDNACVVEEGLTGELEVHVKHFELNY